MDTYQGSLTSQPKNHESQSLQDNSGFQAAVDLGHGRQSNHLQNSNELSIQHATSQGEDAPRDQALQHINQQFRQNEKEFLNQLLQIDMQKQDQATQQLLRQYLLQRAHLVPSDLVSDNKPGTEVGSVPYMFPIVKGTSSLQEKSNITKNNIQEPEKLTSSIQLPKIADITQQSSGNTSKAPQVKNDQNPAVIQYQQIQTMLTQKFDGQTSAKEAQAQPQITTPENVPMSEPQSTFMPENQKMNDVSQNLPVKNQQEFAKQQVVDHKDLPATQFESAQNQDQNSAIINNAFHMLSNVVKNEANNADDQENQNKFKNIQSITSLLSNKNVQSNNGLVTQLLATLNKLYASGDAPKQVTNGQPQVQPATSLNLNISKKCQTSQQNNQIDSSVFNKFLNQLNQSSDQQKEASIEQLNPLNVAQDIYAKSMNNGPLITDEMNSLIQNRSSISAQHGSVNYTSNAEASGQENNGHYSDENGPRDQNAQKNFIQELLKQHPNIVGAGIQSKKTENQDTNTAQLMQKLQQVKDFAGKGGQNLSFQQIIGGQQLQNQQNQGYMTAGQTTAPESNLTTIMSSNNAQQSQSNNLPQNQAAKVSAQAAVQMTTGQKSTMPNPLITQQQQQSDKLKILQQLVAGQGTPVNKDSSSKRVGENAQDNINIHGKIKQLIQLLGFEIGSQNQVIPQGSASRIQQPGFQQRTTSQQNNSGNVNLEQILKNLQTPIVQQQFKAVLSNPEISQLINGNRQQKELLSNALNQLGTPKVPPQQTFQNPNNISKQQPNIPQAQLEMIQQLSTHILQQQQSHQQQNVQQQLPPKPQQNNNIQNNTEGLLAQVMNAINQGRPINLQGLQSLIQMQQGGQMGLKKTAPNSGEINIFKDIIKDDVEDMFVDQQTNTFKSLQNAGLSRTINNLMIDQKSKRITKEFQGMEQSQGAIGTIFRRNEKCVDKGDYFLIHRLNPGTKRMNQILKCKKCPLKFPKLCNLRDHLRIHNDEMPFQCTLCQKPFTQAGNRDRHEKKRVCMKRGAANPAGLTQMNGGSYSPMNIGQDGYDTPQMMMRQHDFSSKTLQDMQLMDFRMEIDQSNEDLEQCSEDRCSSPKISGSTPGGNNNRILLQHAESEQ